MSAVVKQPIVLQQTGVNEMPLRSECALSYVSMRYFSRSGCCYPSVRTRAVCGCVPDIPNALRREQG